VAAVAAVAAGTKRTVETKILQVMLHINTTIGVEIPHHHFHRDYNRYHFLSQHKNHVYHRGR